jgi:glycosyltransferase involved in cell wall biosynthesis
VLEENTVKVLILSFYYPPDLSAGSFRTSSLVAALQKRGPRDLSIDVVTTLPNRYRTFSQAALQTEASEGLQITRVALPAHSSDMLGQARAFLTYARQVLRIVAARRYDLVFATSSRLMTAALGAQVARRQNTPLYLDIRDLFVDTIGEILPRPLAIPLRLVFSGVESWTMRRAKRINLVSPGFEDYFRRRYANSSLAWFTNGIDEEFLQVPADAQAVAPRTGPTKVLYAGNIGEGQGLHGILPTLAAALQGRANFHVVGDGGRRERLREEIARCGLDNVTFHGPVPRADLLGLYRDADVLFLHLGPYSAFEKVLPSKIFEYAALGKPILAGVSGYAARFLAQEVSNSAVFPPGDAEQAVRALQTLDLVTRPRPEFVKTYARTCIARAMAEDVLATLPCESQSLGSVTCSVNYDGANDRSQPGTQ